jgi:DNA-binding GntR family transcriptional regulator
VAGNRGKTRPARPAAAPRARRAGKRGSAAAAADAAGRDLGSAAPPGGAGVFPDRPLEDGGRKGPRGARAYRLMREAIATGRLKPGARVLESELAAMLAMSRTPIREAIAALEADGLVSIDGARGRVVTKLDYHSIMELYAVREVLESTSAGLAARNASDMEILALRDMLELEERILGNAGKLADHNRRFHEAIYYCSHNRYILKMLQYIQTGMLLLGPASRSGDDRRGTGLVEHRAIVDSIEQRDPAASEAAMRRHIRSAQQARIKLLLQGP